MYDKFGRTYLFDLDFYYLRKLDEDEQKRCDNAPSSQEAERFSSTYTIDAFHVGNVS
jgi:[histone H3]-lysine9 N-trimethyltransferase SUV39H